jgi:hypothetical protein
MEDWEKWSSGDCSTVMFYIMADLLGASSNSCKATLNLICQMKFKMTRVLHHLHSSTNIIMVTKSRMRCAGHVSHTGKMMHKIFLGENCKRRQHLEWVCIDGRKVIIEWILTEFTWLKDMVQQWALPNMVINLQVQ